MARVEQSLNRIADTYVVVGVLVGLCLAIIGIAVANTLGSGGWIYMLVAVVIWGVQVFITVTLFRAAAEAIKLLRSINRRLAPPHDELPGSEEFDDADEVGADVLPSQEGVLCDRCRFRVMPQHSQCPGCGKRREEIRPVVE